MNNQAHEVAVCCAVLLITIWFGSSGNGVLGGRQRRLEHAR